MHEKTHHIEPSIEELQNEIAELKARNKLLENLIDALPGHVYWLDRDNVYLGCNKQQALDVGLDSGREIVGKTNFDFMSNKEASAINASNSKVMRTGKFRVAEEVVGKSKDKNKRIYLTEKAPLHDSKGKVIGLVGVSFDITERKSIEEQLEISMRQAEEAERQRLFELQKITKATTGKDSNQVHNSLQQLQELVDYLENIIALMPGHIYWKDANGRYLGCNDQQARFLGFKSGKEIIGKTDAELPWGIGADQFFRMDQRVVRLNKVYEHEEPIIRPNNKPIIFLSRKVPLHDSKNKVIGVLGVSIDITERKNLEKQLIIAKEKAEKASLAKTEFIANISHDIRTPLSGIIGMMQFLYNEVADHTQKEYIRSIHKTAGRLLHILDEVIEFSKAETGQLPIKTVPFDLKKTIQEIIETLFPKLINQKIKIKLIYSNTIPRKFVADYSRINRVVLNLLSNAKKFTKKGSITVEVSLIRKKKQLALMQLTFTDTGSGIDEEHIAHIFDKFFKSEASYKTNIQSTGLGLSIVKEFVKDLKGEIMVASKLNSGTTFTVVLPLQITNQSLEKEMALNIKKFKKNKMKQSRILLIEDDQICQLTERLLLSELGYQIEVAATGKQALKMLQQSYDLIICDIGLPDITGMELAAKIRNSDGPNCKKPIIALTAHVSRENTQQYNEIGINKILRKPMDRTTTHNIIQQLLRSK